MAPHKMKVKIFQVGKGPEDPEFEGEVGSIHWFPDSQTLMGGFIKMEKGVLNIGLNGNLKVRPNPKGDSTLFISPLFPSRMMVDFQKAKSKREV